MYNIIHIILHVRLIYGPADHRTTELENPVELKETTFFITTAFGGTVVRFT